MCLPWVLALGGFGEFVVLADCCNIGFNGLYLNACLGCLSVNLVVLGILGDGGFGFGWVL